MAPEADPQHTFDWEGTPPGDYQASAPEPEVAPARSARPRLLLGGLGVAALVAAAVVVLAGGGGGAASTHNSPVVLAADTTTQQPGYKYEITVSVAAAGQNVSLSGSGEIDTGPPVSGSMTATVGGVSLNERIVAPYAYVQSSDLGNTWERIDLAGLSGLDSSSPQLGSTDPAALLAYLRASGSVTDEGPQTLNGVATTHYHGVINLDGYAATVPAAQRAAAAQAIAAYEQASGSSTLPVDVWIDDTNLVRQLDMDLSVASAAGNVSVSFSMSFYDYGPQAAVTAPPASQVADLPAPAGASAPSAPAPSTGSPTTGSSPNAD